MRWNRGNGVVRQMINIVKRKPMLLMGILMILCLIIISCNDVKIWGEKLMENNRTEEKVTKEYLLETYGITDEDLEGIELENIIEKYKLYVSKMERFRNNNKDGVLNFFRISQELIDEKRLLDENSKAYLLEAKEYEGEFPDIKTIKYLVYEFDSGSCGVAKRSTFVDFEKNTLYFNGGITVVREYLRADDIVEFTESQKETILERLEKIRIDQWEYYYNKGRAGKYLTWDLGMEFEDGTIISKHGDFSDKGEPSNIDEFAYILWDILDGRLE